MKQFRLLKSVCLFALLATMSVMTTSCDKEDNEVVSGIVGVWSDTDEHGGITFSFNADGTGSVRFIEVDDNGHSSDEVLQFSYAYNEKDGVLKLYITGSNIIYNYKVTLTGNTLMLTDSEGTYVLKRK